ncbi:MAG: MgtC/SapB family protein [Candidatus Binatia bacterium]
MIAELQIIGEDALAMVLGGLIGFERDLVNKPAGLRTHMLIAGAAALLVGLGDALVWSFVIEGPTERLRSDPIRIVEAVITGISFLGAGTIFRHGRSEQVEGLTTAAAMLITGSIGIATALGQWLTAVGATALALLVLRGAALIERRMIKKANGQ